MRVDKEHNTPNMPINSSFFFISRLSNDTFLSWTVLHSSVVF